MATVLDRELKRAIKVDGIDYVVTFDAEGMRVTGKGKRKAQVELRWRDLLNGEAALAVALNASLVPAPKGRSASAPTSKATATARAPAATAAAPKADTVATKEPARKAAREAARSTARSTIKKAPGRARA